MHGEPLVRSFFDSLQWIPHDGHNFLINCDLRLGSLRTLKQAQVYCFCFQTRGQPRIKSLESLRSIVTTRLTRMTVRERPGESRPFSLDFDRFFNESKPFSLNFGLLFNESKPFSLNFGLFFSESEPFSLNFDPFFNESKSFLLKPGLLFSVPGLDSRRS